jgi:hypothetical protein
MTIHWVKMAALLSAFKPSNTLSNCHKSSALLARQLLLPENKLFKDFGQKLFEPLFLSSSPNFGYQVLFRQTNNTSKKIVVFLTQTIKLFHSVFFDLVVISW